MQKVKVLHNQSLLDLGIQAGGNVQVAFDIAMKNNISLTDLLMPNMELNLPDSQYVNKDIQGYYDRNQIKPATKEHILIYSALGIGEMTIGSTFIIG